jgi:hypothetical protein
MERKKIKDKLSLTFIGKFKTTKNTKRILSKNNRMGEFPLFYDYHIFIVINRICQFYRLRKLGQCGNKYSKNIYRLI